MTPPDVPFPNFIGTLLIAIIGGIISRYVQPYVVNGINFAKRKGKDIPRWQKILSFGIIIGVLITSLPEFLNNLLKELERLGFQPAESVSNEVMLGFAVTAVLSLQFRQTSLIRSSLMGIENS